MLFVVCLLLPLLFVDPWAFDLAHTKAALLAAAGGTAALVSLVAGALRRDAALPLPAAIAWLAMAWALLFVRAAASGRADTEAGLRLATLLLLVIVGLTAAARTFSGGRRLAFLLLFGGTVSGALSLAQARGLPFPYHAGSAPGGAAVSFFGNPNEAGAFFAPLVGFGAALAGGSPGLARFAALATAASAAGVFLSKSRGAALAAVCALAAAAWAVRRFGGGRIRWGLGSALAGVAIAGLCQGTLALDWAPWSRGDEGAADPSYPSTVQRLSVARATLELIRERPLLGHGPGSFPRRFPLYREKEEAATPTLGGALSEVEDPHDEYLLLAAEGGLLALLCLVFALWAAFRAGRAAVVLPAGHPLRALGAAAVAGLAGAAVAMLFRSTLLLAPAAVATAVLVGMSSSFAWQPPASRGAGPIGSVVVALHLLVAVWFGGRALLGDLLLARGAAERAAALEQGDPLRERDSDRWLEAAVSLCPDHFAALQFLAARRELDALDDESARHRAIELRRRLLEVRPNHFVSLVRLAALLLWDGRPALAEPLVRRARLVAPAPATGGGAVMFEALGLEGAATLWEAWRVRRGRLAPSRLLERAERWRERDEPALELVCRATLADVLPDQGDHAFRAAELARELGREDEARRWFGRAHAAYALEHLAAGRIDDARRSAERSLRSWRNDEAKAVLWLVGAAAGDTAPPPQLALGEGFRRALASCARTQTLRAAVRSLLSAARPRAAASRGSERDGGD